jgi:4a-hydroxytetrahydrobiopterin dehydratase
MSPLPLKPAAIITALSTLPGWEQHGPAITKTWKFKTYLAGIDFVTEIAKAAEALDHHPDLQVGWRKVQATLCTHVANGLTEYDIELARQIDKLYETHGA